MIINNDKLYLIILIERYSNFNNRIYITHTHI